MVTKHTHADKAHTLTQMTSPVVAGVGWGEGPEGRRFLWWDPSRPALPGSDLEKDHDHPDPDPDCDHQGAAAGPGQALSLTGFYSQPKLKGPLLLLIPGHQARTARARRDVDPTDDPTDQPRYTMCDLDMGAQSKMPSKSTFKLDLANCGHAQSTTSRTARVPAAQLLSIRSYVILPVAVRNSHGYRDRWHPRKLLQIFSRSLEDPPQLPASWDQL